MRKILIMTLLLLFVATSALANTISWLGESGSGRVGLGVSRDGIGFIVFEDIDGALTYIYADARYDQDNEYNSSSGAAYTLAHKICITHGPALFITHTPNTEAGYFDLGGVGRPLIWHLKGRIPRQ